MELPGGGGEWLAPSPSPPGPSVPEEAILEPGAELSYQLDSDTDPKARRSLLIYSNDDKGNPVGNPTRLLLDDKYVGGMVVAFWPAGYSDDKSAASKMLYEKDTVRFTWPENSPTTNIWVKRETDGWSVPASAANLSWYPDPNDRGTTDWGIVSIHIDTFPAARRPRAGTPARCRWSPPPRGQDNVSAARYLISRSPSDRANGLPARVRAGSRCIDLF